MNSTLFSNGYFLRKRLYTLLWQRNPRVVHLSINNLEGEYPVQLGANRKEPLLRLSNLIGFIILQHMRFDLQNPAALFIQRRERVPCW